MEKPLQVSQSSGLLNNGLSEKDEQSVASFLRERDSGTGTSVPLASASHHTRADSMKPVVHAMITRSPS